MYLEFSVYVFFALTFHIPARSRREPFLVSDIEFRRHNISFTHILIALAIHYYNTSGTSILFAFSNIYPPGLCAMYSLHRMKYRR